LAEEPGTVSWRQLQAEASRRLAAAGPGQAETDARRLVEEASGLEGADYVLGLDAPATVRGVASFDRMLERRLDGEPLQYVLGHWGFRTLDLFVDARVLIPRPETEQVTGFALDELDRHSAAGPLLVADLGTGSGAIGLSIAAECGRAEVWITDRSTDALAVAGANLAGLGRAATRLRLAEGSWFEALPAELQGRLDLVISNPPYVAPEDPLPPEVAHWEPREALIPGPTGLESLLHLVEVAPLWLARPGVLVLELAPDQAEAVSAAARVAGFDEVSVRQDLAGRNRAVVARLASS
jgi:release factor glutamine methyltransferase